jgi:hypothetical protein
MSEKCEICGQAEADRLLGHVEDPGLLLDDQHISLDKDRVFLVCAGCATRKVESGYGREMPIGHGDAAEIWYRDRLELTDGIQSITKKSREPVSEWA